MELGGLSLTLVLFFLVNALQWEALDKGSLEPKKPEKKVRGDGGMASGFVFLTSKWFKKGKTWFFWRWWQQ